MNLLHNATIIDSGKRFRGYLAFENEYITHVGCGNVPQALVRSEEHTSELQSH